MIPKNLTRQDYRNAVKEIDRHGVPSRRASTRYEVVINGKRYPPKLVVSLASKFASGREWSSTRFNAIEARDHFLGRDFKVFDKRRHRLVASAPRRVRTSTTTSRRNNEPFAQLVVADRVLSPIVGSTPLTRIELTKRLWGYIKRNVLQDKKDRRMINADDRLRAVFGGRAQVNMFRMTSLVAAHCEAARPSDLKRSVRRARSRRSTRHRAPGRHARGSNAQLGRSIADNVTQLAEIEKRLTEIDALDIPASARRRAEQPHIRELLLAGRTTAKCALCDREMPSDLLVAAHIKPRALCTDKERRAWSANTMLACVFGCDDLFEKHYVEVRNGRIIRGSRVAATVTVRRAVSTLTRRKCMAWSVQRSRYFKWHTTQA